MATTHTNSHSFSSSEHSSSQCTSTVHSPLRGQLRSTSSTSSTQCRETRDIAHPDGWPDTSATVITETKAERNGSLRPPGVARYKSEHDSGMYQDGLWTSTEHHACPAGSGSIQPVPSVSLSFVTTDDPNHPVCCRTSVGSPPSGTLDDRADDRAGGTAQHNPGAAEAVDVYHLSQATIETSSKDASRTESTRPQSPVITDAVDVSRTADAQQRT